MPFDSQAVCLSDSSALESHPERVLDTGLGSTPAFLVQCVWGRPESDQFPGVAGATGLVPGPGSPGPGH